MSLPCKYITEIPTLDKTGAAIDPDATAAEVARDWLQIFEKAVISKDAQAVSSLFLQDSFWKDILALTGDFRTIHGASNINSLLKTCLPRVELSSLKLARDPLRKPSMPGSVPVPGLTLVEVFFDFETKVGKGSGICRLAPTENPGTWKAYLMFTCLDALKDFPEKQPNVLAFRGMQVGALRTPYPYYDGNWEENRQRQREFLDGDPTVLIVGGGHSGLEIAARLRYIGISCLVVEKNLRIGDNWRGRYKTLCLHDPIWFNTTPFLPFPSTWPVYAPAPKLADWLESYAHTLELDVWTSSKLTKATWDNETQSWRAEIIREGKGSRVLTVKHLVFATGFGGGMPKIPDIPGKELFKGLTCHSSQFTTAKDHVGKKAIVVGSCSSGHDIAHDFLNHGVDVTMYQRSSTFVISTQGTMTLLSSLYNEIVPTDFADHMSASLPFTLVKMLHQGATQQIANTCDKDLIEGLEKAGFQTNTGIDGSGILPLVFHTASGYYIDTGTSKHIINGDIKLKNSSAIERFTEKGLKFADGSELEAGVVVFATGYGDMRDSAEGIIDPNILAKVGPIWGYDAEGEVNGTFRPLGIPGLWFGVGNFALVRFYSKHLAMLIKAAEEGFAIA